MSDVIERANAALDGVTPGPWQKQTWGVLGDADGLRAVEVCLHPKIKVAVYPPSVEYQQFICDNGFIAAARQLVPDMRDEIIALRARIAELEVADKTAEADIDSLVEHLNTMLRSNESLRARIADLESRRPEVTP